MPRSRRLDAPGMVHHIWIRGVEGQTIFLDDDDREDFVRRLSIVLPDAGTWCLAWALLANHAHLVLRSGRSSISQVMRRVNTGYARRFNDRHDRFGYLFQSRFGSRLATDDGDLRRLVRYVHLNPLAAGLVDRRALDEYQWSGHSALVAARAPHSFEDLERVLELFGSPPEAARQAMRRFLRSHDAGGDPPAPSIQSAAPSPGPDVDNAAPEIVVRAAVEWSSRHVGVPAALIDGRSNARAALTVRARSIAIALATGLGIPGAEVARYLRLSAPSISRLRCRGVGELGELGELGESARSEVVDLVRTTKL